MEGKSSSSWGDVSQDNNKGESKGEVKAVSETTVNGSEEGIQTFSVEQAREWFTDNRKVIAQEDKKVVIPPSPICAALIGYDGTGKTGVALDCWTEEAIKQGKRVVIIDLDQSAAPIINSYHNDKNIVLADPTILDYAGDIDYVSTHNKLMAIVGYLVTNQKEANLHAVIMDGLDTLLKIHEYVMRYLDLKTDPDTRVDSFDWGKRNRRYFTVIQLLKKMRCEKYYTTHIKDEKDWGYDANSKKAKKTLKKTGEKVVWQDATPGHMFQIVRMEKRELSEGPNSVEITAHVDKAKGALQLESNDYVVGGKTREGEPFWHGMREFFDFYREEHRKQVEAIKVPDKKE